MSIDYSRLNRFADGRYPRDVPGGGGRRVLVIGMCVVVAGLGALGAWWYFSPGIDVEGLSDGEYFTPEALTDTTVAIDVDGGGPATITLNGVPTTATERDGKLMWEPPELEDGTHELRVSTPRRVTGTLSTTVEFTVDSEPPPLRIDTPEPSALDEATTLTGRTDPGASVELDTGNGPFTATADESGRFTLEADHPPVGRLSATDVAGNITNRRVATPVRYPGARAVHVTSAAWGNPQTKSTIVGMIEDGRIDTVQLDLKDEAGVVGYDSSVPLASEIGAARSDYALDEALEELHELDARVVGRIVAFRDPKLADAAWERGDTDWVVQSPDGGRLAAYDGGFVNFAHQRVRRYNLALATEAARAGIDEIMWDYVRRPEGPLDSMVFQNQRNRAPGQLIVSFLAQAHQRLRPLGVHHNAAVFGIAIDRGQAVAQNIEAMARHVDALSPMVYPSHWNAGEYGVADPDRQPYAIVLATVGSFTDQVDGTGTHVTPWLQDFDSVVDYGRKEVRAQLRASREAGAAGVFLWDPDVDYTADGLPVIE